MALGASFGQRDLDAGMVAVETGQQAGHVKVRGGYCADDPRGHVPAGQPRKGVHGVAHGVHRRQRGPGVGEHRGAGLGDPHRAAGAVQENLAEFSFPQADLRADAGLGHVGLGGGPGEAGFGPGPGPGLGLGLGPHPGQRDRRGGDADRLAGGKLRARWPLIDLRLLRNRPVLAANLTAFLIALGFYPLGPLVVRFVQTAPAAGYGFGASVLVAGLMLTPFSLASFAASQAVRHAARRVSPEAIVVAGCIALVASMALFVLSRVPTGRS